jgi:hypothetical protein
MGKKESKIIMWLRSHDLIGLDGLEKEAGLPQGTLSKAMKQVRGLPSIHDERIAKALKPYGYK